MEFMDAQPIAANEAATPRQKSTRAESDIFLIEFSPARRAAGFLAREGTQARRDRVTAYHGLIGKTSKNSGGDCVPASRPYLPRTPRFACFSR
jgi:hypothetical protein